LLAELLRHGIGVVRQVHYAMLVEPAIEVAPKRPISQAISNLKSIAAGKVPDSREGL
jgi:hypothetical protein